MKKLVIRIFLIINICVAVLMIMSSLSVYISPEKIWFCPFFGLLFPYFLVANILFLILWIILKKRFFFISLLVIIFSWSNLNKFIQLNPFKSKPPPDAVTVKLLSYNVRLFNYYNWLKVKSADENILTFIEKENADLICLQEFFTIANNKLSEDSIRKSLYLNPYIHIYYTDVATNKRSLGMATYSSWPIVSKGVIKFADTRNASIYTDIRIHDDTVRIYNCHLQSTQLQKENYNFLDSIIFNYNTRRLTEIKDISHKLRNAYIKRARQVDILSNHIKNSPYPCLVCGDFNDTPVSYTYHKLKGKLKDAYLESGTGIGNTYLGGFPSFRIDYILHSRAVATFNFKTKRIRLSDHYPIICHFFLKEDND